jgi:ferrous iron transport protein A
VWAPAAGTNVSSMTMLLCQLPAGMMGRIQAITGDVGFCQRIRELGFDESAVITKLGGTGPFLCQVNDTRITLDHGAAAQIVVTPVT